MPKADTATLMVELSRSQAEEILSALDDCRPTPCQVKHRHSRAGCWGPTALADLSAGYVALSRAVRGPR